jgi:hypothetical protein
MDALSNSSGCCVCCMVVVERLLFTMPGENKHFEGIICLLEHGADVNMMNNVSTATRGVAVMVEMVGCGEG